MFDKHYYIKEDKSVEAARINAKSKAMLARKIESISQAEIKSKDRVDISLEEYERLKSEVKRLSERERALMSVIERFKIPADVLDYILPDSVKIYTCADMDFMNDLQHYRIEFSIPRDYLKGF